MARGLNKVRRQEPGWKKRQVQDIQEFIGSTIQQEGRGQWLHASGHTSALQVLL